MSRRNQSRRRRSYGRRQHELGERRTQPEIRLFLDDVEGRRAWLHDPGEEAAADGRPLAGA